MTYIFDKTGDFDSSHEVHKDSCPNCPKSGEAYRIDGQFESDLEAIKYIQKTHPSLNLRPCTICMDMSSRWVSNILKAFVSDIGFFIKLFLKYIFSLTKIKKTLTRA